MSKRNSKKYKKIYERHHGPIPKDETGRMYEIHHIDGNSDNNDITNLIALTIHEHYEIHYWQEDWSACLLMSERMMISSEEKSELARKSALSRVENGTHPWQKRSDGTSFASDLVKKGIHNLQKRSDGTSVTSDRIKSPGYVSNFSGVNRTGKLGPHYDHTIYSFKNKNTNEVVTSTQRELIDNYQLDNGHVSRLVNGQRKSHKGWILIDKSDFFSQNDK
jgi:hypothetical protein